MSDLQEASSPELSGVGIWYVEVPARTMID